MSQQVIAQTQFNTGTLAPFTYLGTPPATYQILSPANDPLGTNSWCVELATDPSVGGRSSLFLDMEADYTAVSLTAYLALPDPSKGTYVVMIGNPSLYGTGLDIIGLEVGNNGSRNLWRLKYQHNGVMVGYVDFGTVLPNRKYEVTVYCKVSNGDGEVRISVDDVELFSITGLVNALYPIRSCEVGAAWGLPTTILVYEDIQVVSGEVAPPPPTITYALTIQTGAGGTTSPIPGIYPIEQGLTQQVSASAYTGFQFANWLLDGVIRTENPISITMNTNHTVQAVFTPIITPPPTGGPTKLHVDGKYIKDANGNIVYLRGANYFLYTGTHGKAWLTSAGEATGANSDWNTQVVPAIKENFDKMRSFNFNCFRMHTLPQDVLQSPDFISHMQQIASLAAERGLYMILDIYSVADVYPNTNYMPYPPYSSAADALVIPNEQAFVDMWATIANAMKNYSNVMFELYNEPVGFYRTDPSWYPRDFNSMMNTYQQCIARIRQITDQIIIVQWGYTIGVDLAGPWLWDPSLKMNVLADDPRVQETNIVYTWHWYEGNPQRNQDPNINDVASLTQYLSWAQIDDVASRKAVLVTELGGLVGNPTAITWMTNAIDLLYARGIGFIDWVWSAPLMTAHGDEIIATAPNFQLTDKGVIFTQKTLSIPSTPTPPPTTFNLVVTSTPVTAVPVSVDTIQYTTPTLPLTLQEGTHIIVVPSNVLVGSDIYNFKQWEDGSTNPTRTINLTSDLTITCTYQLQAPPPPAKGFLEIHAFLDSQEIVAPYEIVGITSGNTPAQIEVNVGNYTVNVTYQGQVKTENPQVTEGQTIRLDFQFGTTPTPPAPMFPVLVGKIIQYPNLAKIYYRIIAIRG
jgi:hypothetical protein